MNTFVSGILTKIMAKKAFSIDSACNDTSTSVAIKRLLKHCSENNLPLTDSYPDEVKSFQTEEECVRYLSTLPDNAKYIIAELSDETSDNSIKQMQEYGFKHVQRKGYIPIKLVDKNGNFVVKGSEICNTMGSEGIVSAVSVVCSVCFAENCRYGVPEFRYIRWYNITLSDYKMNSVLVSNSENATKAISKEVLNQYWFVKPT